jgi:long-chain acyl-CoA synthetase
MEQLQSVIEILGHRALTHPKRSALIEGNRHLSYGELWRRVEAVAEEFTRCAVGTGDRVLLAAPNSSAFVCAYLATQLVGAVAVPFDPNLPKAARDDLIARIEPKLAFGEKEDAHVDLLLRDYSELESLPGSEAEFGQPVPNSVAELVFTTGTTRRPKGVSLTHRNLLAAARHINRVIGIREGDVEVMPLPLFRTFGLGRLRCNLIAGATVVLVDGFRLPGEIFTAIDRHRATGLVGVPAGFAVLLRFGQRGLGVFADRLRYIEIGSAPMPIEHKRMLMDLLPKTELWMHYGLTEAARSAFIEFHRHHDRLDTVGLPAPGVQLEVRSENGSVCHSGGVGRLWIRGDHVALGYWRDPESTVLSFVDGWVHTGDVAHLESDGFLVLHGRSDDMINIGGFKVLPDQIEGVLGEHPAVLEAMCIGVPDPRKITGEIVRAYLVQASAKVSDEELSRWVAARLERYKVPLQYVWIETLPRNSSGKLTRAILRNQAASEQ